MCVFYFPRCGVTMIATLVFGDGHAQQKYPTHSLSWQHDTRKNMQPQLEGPVFFSFFLFKEPPEMSSSISFFSSSFFFFNEVCFSPVGVAGRSWRRILNDDWLFSRMVTLWSTSNLDVASRSHAPPMAHCNKCVDDARQLDPPRKT